MKLVIMPTTDDAACCGPSGCTPTAATTAPPAETRSAEAIRAEVRARYGAIAMSGDDAGCCGTSATSCCSPSAAADPTLLGYTPDDGEAAPEGSNLGLGCGNPQAIASLRPGDTVLDLGSGAGFDAFLAARSVGSTGRVIGVDMTHEMLARARSNADKGGYTNVEFRLGEIEHLPVADNVVDVILSNCVINLSPDKAAVFRESFRVLKPGGRLAVADVVARSKLSPEHAADLGLLVGCIAGASTVDELTGWLKDAGFTQIRIGEKAGSRQIVEAWAPGHPAVGQVMSATIEAVKP